MKRQTILLSIAIFVGFFPQLPASSFDHETITMFAENVVEMPKGVLSAQVSQVTFNPDSLKVTLLSYGAETMTVAFPDFNPADTIIQSSRFPELFARQARLDRIYRIYLADPANRDALNQKLKDFPEVYFSDKNGTGELASVPDDVEFYRQWGMHNTGQNQGVPDADIDAPEAWDLTQGDASTVIAIMDNGVQGHIEYAGRLAGDGPGEYFDDHGTFVTGIAAAQGNNDEGIAGVTWNSQIYSKDIHTYDEVHIYFSVIDAIQNGGADVLNNSWVDLDFRSLVHQAFGIAHDLGHLVVAASGNQGDDTPIYPASYPGDWVLSVGAFTDQDSRSYFSSYGNGLDVVAPGGTTLDGRTVHEIYSTGFGNTYHYDGGTSFAAPHVSGMVGLLDFYNQLPAFGSNFRYVIVNTAVDIPPTGYDELTGYGRVNARAALDFISRPNRIYTCDAAGSAPYLANPEPPIQEWRFKGTRDLVDHHVYAARQYEVLYDVNYLSCDCQPPLIDPLITSPVVWGIDCLTNGWSNSEPNGGIRKCEVVASDQNSATLRTYVYQVWRLLPTPTYLGFFPNHWQDCTFGFTILADGTPLPPSNLAVTASANYHPLISWDYSPTSDISAYKIYRMVHGIEEDWVHIGSVSSTVNQYEDIEYSTPHDGPYALWIDDADYTVTAVNQYAESDMPPFVTIIVLVPARPDPTPFKQSSPLVEIPENFALYSAYPNPFNSQTIIKYALPEDSHVVIEIFNISGQKIETLISETKPAGYHEIVWDASNVASGTYLYKIDAGHFSETKRMTLLK